MKNKTLIFLLFSSFLSIFMSYSSYSCEIVIRANKKHFRLNEIAIISVKLVQTHNRCYREGSIPAHKMIGLKLLSKSVMHRINDYEWRITYRVRVLKKNAYFESYRRCPRGGGVARLYFKVN